MTGQTVLLLLAAAGAAGAQGAGSAAITLTGSPAFESWSFGAGGLQQPTAGGGANVMLSGATQISLPLVLAVPLGTRWRLDLSSGFASSNVSLVQPDAALQTSEYSLSGITDTKFRLSGNLIGESVLLTLGLSAPTGKSELEAEELNALRVAAAPALGFQIPQLGGGGGGTAGLVFARQMNNWAWALGASYELRNGYAPISFASGVASPDFNPGEVLHFSLGGDGLAGKHGMSVALSADIFSEDEISGTGAALPGSKLGPIFTAEWRMRFATTRLQELSLSLVDRFRTAYQRNGETVDGSSGNYFEAALLAVHSLSPSSSLAWEVSGRHHTGLKSDSALTSAAMNGAGLRLSLMHELRGGTVLQPYARAQFANLENGNATGKASGFSVGLTVSAALRR